MNVNGARYRSAIRWASGARLITTLVHELERSDTELGLSTMCTAGGLGTATLIRRA